TNNGLQVLGLGRIIFQRQANFADGGIDSLFDIDENIFPAQCVGNLLASYQLALVFDQKHQQLQRKTFQTDRLPAAVELKAAKIHFEFGEANLLVGHEASNPNITSHSC